MLIRHNYHNLSHELIKTILVIIIFSTFIRTYSEDIFVIGTFNIKDTTLLRLYRDSLKINTIRSSWIDSEDSIEAYLSFAKKIELKVILGDACGGGNRLSRYYYMYRRTWESESNYVFHETGGKVYDNDASNRHAWFCKRDRDSQGVMQYGPTGWQAIIQTHYTKPLYIVQFRLKIDPEDLVYSEPVCRLAVIADEKNKTLMITDTVLYVRDFTGESQYEFFNLTFKKDYKDQRAYEFRIWWFGNVNLWSDCIVVKDKDIDPLLSGIFDDSLNIIFSNYQEFPALSYFYLKDEPFYGQFEANEYLMNYLDEHHERTPGIQALGAQGEEFFADYASIVKPSVLMLDKYPIRDKTPRSGALFQNALDELCKQLSDIRAVAVSKSLDFWFIVQAFGIYDSADPDSGGLARKWRLPTPQELSCMTWLALAHGAKGIFYYCIESRLEDSYFLRGLWCFNNTLRDPLYAKVKEVNQTLSVIGSTLLSLDLLCTFKSDSIPKKFAVRYIDSPVDLQIAVFENGRKENFLIMVNRNCHPPFTAEASIGIDRRDIKLKDYYTCEILTPDSVYLGNTYFTVPIEAGEGRFFEVVQQ